MSNETGSSGERVLVDEAMYRDAVAAQFERLTLGMNTLRDDMNRILEEMRRDREERARGRDDARDRRQEVRNIGEPRVENLEGEVHVEEEFEEEQKKNLRLGTTTMVVGVIDHLGPGELEVEEEVGCLDLGSIDMKNGGLIEFPRWVYGGVVTMSGAPRVKSMNVADSETRPVLGPTGNNKAGSLSARKPASKQLRKVETSPEEVTLGEEKKALTVSTGSALSGKSHSVSASSVLRRHEQLLHSNLSLNASCSSDASTDSFHSRASTGRLIRSTSLGSRRKPYASKPRSVVSDGSLESPPPSDGSQPKKSCAWVTQIQILVMLLSMMKNGEFQYMMTRNCLSFLLFQEVFADFDPISVSKLNEKKMMAPGSTAISLLSEVKLRAIIENARQISKVIDEFGSFDKYIWSFVNYKPIVSRFRYPRQIPVKTPKADVISKDLVRRGFRAVGPTVVYSFMQITMVRFPFIGPSTNQTKPPLAATVIPDNPWAAIVTSFIPLGRPSLELLPITKAIADGMLLNWSCLKFSTLKKAKPTVTPFEIKRGQDQHGTKFYQSDHTSSIISSHYRGLPPEYATYQRP
ncbi:hypothetical protein GH714_011291 [Hevea brasiliensis]|uniref:Uncharacterized protein n=1 Tax=Hevea brasiliensis TaxID=3981 RepID=A0A6A6MY14_HEVBR|nr:hypothetical protein GH714_011291 [Hevea brasiliensis]